MKAHDNRGTTHGGRVLLAACLASCAGALLFNIMPAFLGAATRSFALGDAELGWLASTYLAGFALPAVSAGWWLARFDHPGCARVGFLLSAGLVAACGAANGYATLLGTMFVAGMGGGLLFALGTVIVSEQDQLERAFGLKLFAEVSAGVALLLLLPTAVYDTWGFSGVAVVTAGAIALAGVVALPRVPRRSPSLAAASEAHGPRPPGLHAKGAIGLFALLLHVAAITGIWSFLERVGNDYGLDEGTISVVLVASMVANIGGALLAVVVGGKHGRAIPLSAGMLAQCAGLAALVWLPSAAGYVIGTMLVNGLWSLILSYQYAIVSDADSQGWTAALIAGAVTVGAAFGPAVVGTLAERSGFATVYATAAAATLTSLVLLIGVIRPRPAVVAA